MSLNPIEYNTISCAASEVALNAALDKAVEDGWLLHSVLPVQQDGSVYAYHVVLYRSAPSQRQAGFPVGGDK